MDNGTLLNLAEICQYKTPNGSKDTSPNGNESESIELVETPSNTYRGPMQESTISSASTNNTDICILDSHYTNEEIQFLPEHDDLSDYENSDEFNESEDDVFLRAVDELDNNEDFTVLQRPTKTRRIVNCPEKRKPTYSGTDSDVEVLMSEEIMISDWSSYIDDVKVSDPNEMTLPSCLQQSCDGNSFKTQASTDLDVSGEELADAAATDKYQNLSRSQLLEIIQKQEISIQALEANVERYKKAQDRLFEHVDALRLELSEIRIMPLEMPKNSEDK